MLKASTFDSAILSLSKVTLDKDKMAESNVDALSIMQMIQANNGSSQSGSFNVGDTEFLLTTGEFISTAEDLENLVIGTSQNMPVYLKQVAAIEDAPSTPQNYVSFGYGNANESSKELKSEYTAHTLADSQVNVA